MASQISNKILQLSRAVVKKHTLDEEKAFKYHLSQLTIVRRMKRKICSLCPWTVNFSWNFPLEMFECFKSAISSEECGGVVVKNTLNIHEIHVYSEVKFVTFFNRLANKNKKTFKVDQTLIKEESDKSYSKIIVSKHYPVEFRYSKKLELLRFKGRYGHYNRVGVPQHTL